MTYVAAVSQNNEITFFSDNRVTTDMSESIPYEWSVDCVQKTFYLIGHKIGVQVSGIGALEEDSKNFLIGYFIERWSKDLPDSLSFESVCCIISLKVHLQIQKDYNNCQICLYFGGFEEDAPKFAIIRITNGGIDPVNQDDFIQNTMFCNRSSYLNSVIPNQNSEIPEEVGSLFNGLMPRRLVSDGISDILKIFKDGSHKWVKKESFEYKISIEELHERAIAEPLKYNFFKWI